jgi:hypothetical protein
MLDRSPALLGICRFGTVERRPAAISATTAAR